MKFTIITPCRNPGALLASTIESVLGQSALRTGRSTLEYLVQDGASTDGSSLLAERLCGERALVVSEPDRGMYDALAKGLRRATGDFVAYLNAGDLYHPSAFDVVEDVFAAHGSRWISGLSVRMNPAGQIVRVDLPFRYRREFLRHGLYGAVLPFVQQESTFWRRELLESVDLERLASLRLAGDSYLWTCFASELEPTIVEAHLGSFLMHAGQLSEDRSSYLGEAALVAQRPSRPLTTAARAELPLWSAPPRVKKWLNRRHLLRWSRETGAWG